MTGFRLAPVALLAAVPGLSFAQDASPTAALPADARVLHGARAEQVFHQCSRRAPEFTPADFEPDAGAIRDLEAKLPAAFAAAVGGLRYRGSGEKLDLGSYNREYAAYMSDGRRRIYGNFAPLTIPPDLWEGPMLVCDGGAAFFGVEYDVERREIVAVEFNGET